MNVYKTHISICYDSIHYIALPDGSHNFYEDSVYFNLPSLTTPNKSVYGVSCYRQISVEVIRDLFAA